MADYSFLSLEEPAPERHRRYIRLALTFVLTLLSISIFGILWRRGRPHATSSIWSDAVNGIITAAIGLSMGDGSRAHAEKIRRNFKLRIEGDAITRATPPLTLTLREIDGIYSGSAGAIWVVGNDRRRKIEIPGSLEQRDAVLRELQTMGLTLRPRWDWEMVTTVPRLLTASIIIAGVVLLFLAPPLWHIWLGTVILLGCMAWYAIRVGGNPNLTHPNHERIVVAILAAAVLCRDAYVLVHH